MPAPDAPPRPRHRDLIAISAYVAVVLLLAAALAPALFAGGKWLLGTAQERGWDQIRALAWFMEPLARTELPGYFDRAALVAALALLWPLLRTLRAGWADVAGESRAHGARDCAQSFGIAIAGLAAMGALTLLLGVSKISGKADWFSVGKPLSSGLAVACIEEFLFRGAMLGILRRSLGTGGAVFWTTFFFAVLHFLKPPAHGWIPDADVRWWSGFAIIPLLFRGFGESGEFVSEFLLLAAVGWMLARARLASGALWAPVGLHAGWVAGMKFFGQITSTTSPLRAREFAPWFAENHCKAIVSPVVGLVPLAFVLLSGALVLRALRARQAGRENSVAGARH